MVAVDNNRDLEKTFHFNIFEITRKTNITDVSY